MGYRVPLGIVNTASTYLGRKLVKAYIAKQIFIENILQRNKWSV